MSRTSLAAAALVLDTVCDVETLTTELSGTIFQKMAQLSRLDPA